MIELEVIRTALGDMFAAALRYAPILFTALVVTLGGWLFSKVPQQFMPESDRPQILVDVKLPTGYGIRESDRRIRELVAWLEDESQNPEIDQTLTYVGSGGVRFFVTIAPEPSRENMGFVLQKQASGSKDYAVQQRNYEKAIGAYEKAQAIKSSPSITKAIDDCRHNLKVSRENQGMDVAESEQEREIAEEDARIAAEKAKREAYQASTDDD